jgi:hypothetical protein
MNSHLGGGTAISPRFIAMPLAEVRLALFNHFTGAKLSLIVIPVGNLSRLTPA